MACHRTRKEHPPMTVARTDWTGWTTTQLDTLIRVVQAANLAAAERDVTNRAMDLTTAYKAFTAAHHAWDTAVRVRDEIKGGHHA